MAFHLEDYFTTVFQDQLLVKLPERDTANLTTATQLLEKRQQLLQLEEALGNQKEEFEAKMDSLKFRRQELKYKEGELKEQIVKFEKFLKENDSKRKRAYNKANMEQELIKQKERDILKLLQEMDRIIQQNIKLKKKLQKYAIYLNYMEQVTQLSEEFQEPTVAKARFETLIITRDDLLMSEGENQAAIKEIKNRLTKFVKQKSNDILMYNNDLTNKQNQLERAKMHTMKLEASWTVIQNTAAKRTLVLGTVRMAVQNLHNIVKKEQGLLMECPVGEINGQLDTIQQYLLDLKEMLIDIYKRDTVISASTLLFLKK
ncbi:coiled-coil domain-containing protein 42 homolog isoform X2 [Callorhinchus milii]|nr:coiled-coil domain-containing protein 42 homolog isoform X2 [Callorhinchus milii]|eukprot:gi/632968401/ref/XP_007900506.1/ PREDICTED: coiled-coil domain-containing protein 42B [Callorhinchus milii]